MLFSTLFVALEAASVFASAIAIPIQARALTVSGVVANINTITMQSEKLQDPADGINLINTPLIVIGQGPYPQIINGYQQIISTCTDFVAAMQGSQQPFTVMSDRQKVLESYTTFVTVQQKLLNTLIDKAEITTLPLTGGPVSAVLRPFEAIVDTIGYQLIDLAGDATDPFINLENSLGDTVSKAIDAYTLKM